MKPLNLYTKTTLLVSAVLTAVLLAVVYFFISTTRDIERQEQEELTRHWVGQLADRLSHTVDQRAQKTYAVIFMDAHEDEIQQIRVYNATKKRLLREVIALPPQEESEEIPAADLALLHQGTSVLHTREVDLNGEKWRVIYAAAPLLDEKSFEGAVSLTLRRRIFSTLSRRLMQLTMALLAAAIISIMAQLYFLFSQVIYRPVTDLLHTMSKVKSGNLDVAVPVRARDEFGKLATDFNHMVARLRAMTAEQEAYQKSLEERVAERTAQLEETNAALYEMQRERTKSERLAAAGQLAAQFAHEVGTPLNLISGHVQLLLARTEDQKTRERLDLIGSQIARIERIVRNMLDATRRPRPELAPLDLNALLRRIFDLTAPTLAARQVELLTELSNSEPFVLGDSEQLQQVFINLINNSLDAMPQGGQLSFKTEIVGQVQDSASDQARIICRDTGTGISEDVRGRIFDPLFTTRRRDHGSGLGLTVVHQIIREHQGTITLTSDSTSGTEFQLTLPLAQAAVNSSRKPATDSNTDADQPDQRRTAEHSLTVGEN